MQFALVIVSDLHLGPRTAGAAEPGRKSFMVERIQLIENAEKLTADVLGSEGRAYYLGRVIHLANMEDAEISHRISKAWAKYGVFRSELQNKHVPVSLRMKLFDTVVTPTILYGCETWTMTQARVTRLRTVQRKMLRGVRGPHPYEDHILCLKGTTRRAEELMATHGLKSWATTQRVKSWQWAGKVAQATDGRWTTTVAAWSAIGDRPRGRPRRRWADAFHEFLTAKTGIEHSSNDWMRIAKDQHLWNSLADAYAHFTDS